MKRAALCIVGGGLTGLAAAYRAASKYGVSTLLLEADERVGGLLRSEFIGGYLFDIGGSHILFSKSEERLRNLLRHLRRVRWFVHRRVTRIYLKGSFVKYPFEVGLADLPPETRVRVLKGMIAATRERAEPKNFLEWIYAVFGEGMAEEYLVPYNRKLWKIPLDEITLEWVGGRVPNPPLDDIIKAAVGETVEAYTHQLVFMYPRKGGIEALAKEIAADAKGAGAEILTSAPVERVESLGNSLRIKYRGGESECGRVIYTAPLTVAPRIIKDLSGESRALLSRLRSVPLAVVGIGARVRPPFIHWVYFPGEETVFHRLAVLSRYSTYNAPKGSASFIAEVSFRSIDELRGTSDDAIVRKVVEGMEYVGLIKASDVEVTSVWRWEHAYPVYDTARSKALRKAIPELKELGIIPAGRFGAWEYLNMDAVYSRGVEAADEALIHVDRQTPDEGG